MTVQIEIGWLRGKRVARKSGRGVRHELEILQRLTPHPNVIALLNEPASEYGSLSVDDYYGKDSFMMEGCTMDLYTFILQKGHPFMVAEALSYFGQIAAGLNHLHSQGLIHHDVKETNILVAEDGTLKICDFGLSEWVDGNGCGNLKHGESGTIRWMAPEQQTGLQITPKIDIYPLGLIGMNIICHRRSWLQKMYMLPMAVTALFDECRAECPTKRPSAATILKRLESLEPLGPTQADKIMDLVQKHAQEGVPFPGELVKLHNDVLEAWKEEQSL